MIHVQYTRMPNAEKLALKLAEDVSKQLRQAIEERGQATLVVSGGSTPKPFFNQLSNIDLPWEKVLVTLADERCVEPTDAASNAKLVKENLLINSASGAKFLGLFNGGTANPSAADKASSKLSDLPTYDVVILGMGGDGHTASIFPKSAKRDLALSTSTEQTAMLIDPVTVTPLRITQTARRLLNTRFLALHMTGSEKSELLNRIIENPDEKQWPIAHFINQQDVVFNVFTDASL